MPAAGRALAVPHSSSGLDDAPGLVPPRKAHRDAARHAASPAELGARLRSLLARRPADADLSLCQPGFPHVPLRPLSLARIGTGPESGRLASRYLDFLQSAVPAESGV
ncbi:hypothetical protein [Streptomyces sp. NPDC088812]|uniref:hypothetical protein n=1 Tax=Streptomyces sp. NPDC088812 TaxID=3365905 RepID=UPI0037F6CBD8